MFAFVVATPQTYGDLKNWCEANLFRTNMSDYKVFVTNYYVSITGKNKFKKTN